MRHRSTLYLCLTAPFAFSAAGCDTLGYYAQAIGGHWELLHARRPISSILSDPGLALRLRNELEFVLEVRKFASQELALPDNGSYRSYADLNRPAVVWSLVATPEFSVEPLSWCYPVVGCAAYRGYFDREEAEIRAEELRREGRDAVVSPVAAYSTLGWFDDPLPNTVLGRPKTQVAGLIFHELAHQQLYISGDSEFNEAFATAVERAGMERWVAKIGGPGLREEWDQQLGREQGFRQLLLSSRERLRNLYSEPRAPADWLAGKAAEFMALRQAYLDLKTSWGGYGGYDRWFDRPLNNASLAAVATYEAWVPSFLSLFRQANQDFSSFYRAAAELGRLPAAERRRRLGALMAAD